MNPLSAPMPPAIAPMMTGPTPTNGVFQHLLNISVTLADAPPNVPVDVVTPATAPICAPAITLALPPLAEVQNWAATEVLPPPTAPEVQSWAATEVLPPATVPEVQSQTANIVLPQPTAPDAQNQTANIVLPQATAPDALNRAMTIVLPQATAPEAQNWAATIVLPPPTAPENSIEDADTVAAEKAEASSPPTDLALVPTLMVHIRPPVSAPADMPAPQIAPQALTPSDADAALVPTPSVQIRPPVSAPADMPAPQIAPQASTPSVADAALVPTPTVQMRPPVSAPAPMPVTPLAPQIRILANMAETPKPLDAAPAQTPAQTPAQWLPSVPQEPVKRADAMPIVRPVSIPAPLLTKQNKPQLPSRLPAHNLGLVDDPLFSFEPQSGIRATVVSVAPTVPPTGTPIAELRQLVITADGEWIGALARDIVSHAAHDNQLAFTLVPEHLGQLDVAVTTDNGEVDIWLETSTQAAAQAISAEQARLIEDLRHAGLKLGQFDMSSRQNGNGQQQAPPPDSQHTDNDSTPAQAKAFSKAQGRFA